jgi:methyl-CpG-binding domain protein 2
VRKNNTIIIYTRLERPNKLNYHHYLSDLKPTSANQEKPKQLFWEKRLEHLRACDGIDGAEFSSIDLPKGLVPVGPFVDEATLLHSVSTSLHTSVATVVGQSKSAITNSVYIDPDQPLMQKLKVDIEDIRKQEERVLLARKKLQEALMK